MRAKAHKLETIGTRFAVDEHEIRLKMTIAVILPFAGERMVEIPAWQRRVRGKQIHYLHEHGVQLFSMPIGFCSLIVPLKACSVFNVAHSNLAAVCQASRL